MRRVAALMLITFVGMAGIVFAPRPASACSCAWPGDLGEAIANSDAAFVGTLVSKQETGLAGLFGDQAIYTFEVEEWIKGDFGPVIEVTSASNGAACGFEFFGSDRTGAFLDVSGDSLSGSLCTQVDPDVLLAAANPPAANPGLAPVYVVGNWDSGDLILLGASGDLVETIASPIDADPFAGTAELEVCPGDRFMLQQTWSTIVVWSLEEFEVVDSYDIAEISRDLVVSDVSCRDSDASSIWVLAGTGGPENQSEIIEIADDPRTLMSVNAAYGQLGPHNALVRDFDETTVSMLDYETGESLLIRESSPDSFTGLYEAVNPFGTTNAVLEVRYHGDGDPDSYLYVFDQTGRMIAEHKIPFEGEGSPTWVDADRLLVRSVDWTGSEPAVLNLVDLEAGTVDQIDGWSAWRIAIAGNSAAGISNGHLTHANLETGVVTELTVLTSQSAESLVIVADELPEGMPATLSTTPTTRGVPTEPNTAITTPTAASEPAQPATSDGIPVWVWGVAIAVVVASAGVIVWQSRNAD